MLNINWLQMLLGCFDHPKTLYLALASKKDANLRALKHKYLYIKCQRIFYLFSGVAVQPATRNGELSDAISVFISYFLYCCCCLVFNGWCLAVQCAIHFILFCYLNGYSTVQYTTIHAKLTLFCFLWAVCVHIYDLSLA